MKAMRAMAVLTMVAACFLSACGPAEDSSVTPPVTSMLSLDAQLAKAPKIVQRSVTAIGGVKAWQPIRRIEAKVLLSDYQGTAKPYVNRFDVRMVLSPALKGYSLDARAATPGRDIHVRVGPGVKVKSFHPDQNDQLRRSISKAFEIILARVTGPWNILPVDDNVKASRVKILGEDLIRVPAGDGSRGAYYFQPDNGLLKYRSWGADTPGADGTVTIYTYMMMPNGLAFPRKIQVVKVGKHVLVGTEKIIEADFSEAKSFHTI